MVKRRTLSSEASASLAGWGMERICEVVDNIDSDLSLVLNPLRGRLQELLNQLVGKSFDSYQESDFVANKLRDLMIRIGFRVQCPREGCSIPALIRCRPGLRLRAGTFCFEHLVNGRLATHTTSTRLPQLYLIAAEPHRRRKIRRMPT